MTDSTPVGRVASVLEGASYLRLPDLLLVGGLRLEFPAAFVHEKSSTDLILVADTTSEEELTLVRKMNGVARALDVSRSRRSLTLVLTGPRPKSATLEYLSKVCRVLPVGSETGEVTEAAVRNWLAVLLPLTLPQADGAAANPLTRIITLAEKLDEPLRHLVDLAAQGETAVQRGLHQLIDDASSESKEKDL
jgi:hypothetical protein